MVAEEQRLAVDSLVARFTRLRDLNFQLCGRVEWAEQGSLLYASRLEAAIPALDQEAASAPVIKRNYRQSNL